MSEPIPLRVAVCLFPLVASLDFVGPMELLSFLFPEHIKMGLTPPPPYSITATYIHVTKEPVVASCGIAIVPAKTYEEATEQYDILLVPGGQCITPLVSFEYADTLYARLWNTPRRVP